jgi:predicted nucleic-acid-binding Zn-ribbon protein
MPLPPFPMTVKCNQCGWNKTTAPTSDALGPNERFEKCPKCGNPDLQRSRAGKLAALIATAGKRLNL